MRWVRGKVRGPCALPVQRLVKNKSTGPASIADDFKPSVNRHLCYFIKFYRPLTSVTIVLPDAANDEECVPVHPGAYSLPRFQSLKQPIRLS